VSFFVRQEEAQRMWALLSDPGHADSFEKHGEACSPLRRLIEQLAHREYAGRVYAFESLLSFNLTTAPTYQPSDSYDVIGIEYDPGRALFSVGYNRVSPSREVGRHVAGSCICGVMGVAETVDSYVRVLLNRQSAQAEPVAADGTLDVPDPGA
jgi:hypothetical protein